MTLGVHGGPTSARLVSPHHPRLGSVSLPGLAAAGSACSPGDDERDGTPARHGHPRPEFRGMAKKNIGCELVPGLGRSAASVRAERRQRGD